MQDRIAEYCIELLAEAHLGCILDGDVEPECERGLRQLRTGIDSHHLATHVLKLPGQNTVAAAQIQDSLSGLWGKELDDRHPQIAYETRVAFIYLRVPGLLCHGQILAVGRWSANTRRRRVRARQL